MKSVKIYDKGGNQLNHFNNLLNCSIDNFRDENALFKIEYVDHLIKITNSENQYCLYDKNKKYIINEMNEYGISKVIMELDDVENEIVEKLIEKNEK